MCCIDKGLEENLNGAVVALNISIHYVQIVEVDGTKESKKNSTLPSRVTTYGSSRSQLKKVVTSFVFLYSQFLRKGNHLAGPLIIISWIYPECCKYLSRYNSNSISTFAFASKRPHFSVFPIPIRYAVKVDRRQFVLFGASRRWEGV